MIDYEKIKRLRTKLNLTQPEAAKQAGFVMPDGTPHKQRWCDLESGRVSDVNASTLAAIANVLNCSMEVLLKREPQKARR